MLDYETIKKFDTSEMHKVYDKWPQIAKESFESDCEPVEFGNVNHIVFSGMGGSGALGDILSAILSKSNIHVNVVKGYLLPKTVNADTLVVTSSVSGNTVETMTILDATKQFTRKIIAFSSGGKMQDYCTEKNIEYRNIPEVHSPRASFTKFLYSMLKVLSPVIPIKKEDIYESITDLEKLSKQICSSNLSDTNPSLSLAQWIKGIPVIYYPAGLQAAATRFKNSLQENAKSHAISEDIIEACHNGIVSWEKPSDAQPIMIKGDKDYFKTKERWEILQEYFKKNNIDYREVYTNKGNILSKLICLVYQLDYSTIFNAVLSGIDPSPVKSIDFIKERI